MLGSVLLFVFFDTGCIWITIYLWDFILPVNLSGPGIFWGNFFFFIQFLKWQWSVGLFLSYYMHFDHFYFSRKVFLSSKFSTSLTNLFIVSSHDVFWEQLWFHTWFISLFGAQGNSVLCPSQHASLSDVWFSLGPATYS